MTARGGAHGRRAVRPNPRIINPVTETVPLVARTLDIFMTTSLLFSSWAPKEPRPGSE